MHTKVKHLPSSLNSTTIHNTLPLQWLSYRCRYFLILFKNTDQEWFISDRSEHSVYNAKVLVPTTYSVTFKLIRSMIAHRFGKYQDHSTSTPIKLFVFYTGSTHQVHTMCESRFLKNKKLSLCHGLYRPLVAKSSSNSKDVVI